MRPPYPHITRYEPFRSAVLSPGEQARIGGALCFALAPNPRRACATAWRASSARGEETGQAPLLDVGQAPRPEVRGER